jgi:septum site-determining protein MinC
MSDLISIKGNKEQLRMVIDEMAEWQSILTALHSQLEHTGGFFAGATLILELGDRQVNEHQLADALKLMQQYGLQPESLAATTPESRSAARAMGLKPRPMNQYTVQRNNNPAVEEDSTLVCRTVHSGQVIRHHGHVTLIGDVNPGAQIIAGGSIVVWGRLRGLVHAGALGDTAAMVCALDLRPTQLRIANLIARTPDEATRNPPEIARIEQDYIVVESWETYRMGNRS